MSPHLQATICLLSVFLGGCIVGWTTAGYVALRELERTRDEIAKRTRSGGAA